MNLLGKYKYVWLGGSTLFVIICAIALGVWGLKIGIDFTGGTLLEVAGKNKPITTEIGESLKKELEGAGVTNVTLQSSGEQDLIVKAANIDQEKHTKVNEILTKLELEERRFENVGPTVGKDLTQKAVIAVIVASLAIIVFIAYSFRTVPKPASGWRFGVTAVLALVHDVFITIGVFAVLGHFLGYEVDALFITALLTIMGFSVHDTIVVFDRLREHIKDSPISTPAQFEKASNDALVQTLARSLNTSLTVIIVLLAMAVLGGESIRPFVVALLIGITVGTYSSIATATPILVLWQQFAMRHTKTA